MKKLVETMGEKLGDLGFVEVEPFGDQKRSVFIQMGNSWIIRYLVLSRIEHQISATIRLAQPEFPDARIDSRIGWTIYVGEFWGGNKHISEFCNYVAMRVKFLSPGFPEIENAIARESEDSTFCDHPFEFSREASSPLSELVGGLECFEQHCPATKLEEINSIGPRYLRGEIGFDHIGLEVSKVARAIQDKEAFQNATFEGKSQVIGRKLEPFFLLRSLIRRLKQE